ncbi:type VI secretion system Vgr family protein [Chromohalobacter nigrandesensis]|uniref:type VI secretion system Vgr family protein n=1 Tax=Chromohalobacter nigrandesensis TaxID=119863 RepID=UPI001FF4F623|nr:type VI secretion system Vgr family protein [Chromohalobacter nigrandesensis]MCK0746729.1 type VI secretion system tip protein VgrG [Chromohalobacter nigrandesensis]
MADLTTLDSLLDTFDIDLSPSQRLLTLDIAGASLLPHRLVGEERVSEPFSYTLDCISQQGDLELKTLMAQPARLSILQADGGYRQLHGLVAEAALLGEDGGVTYYQLTLVPWLAMLKLGRDSRIFQDRSVVEVLTQVFEGHELARGRYRFDLRRDYPARSYCVQYRESDFNFISRLCEEEGLWYYFEYQSSESADNDDGETEGDSQSFDGHRLVITDDVDTCQPVSPQAIRFHRQAATETEDALNQWGGVRTQQPTRVSVGTFDYKQPSLTKRTGLDTLSDQGNLPATEVYDYAGAYYYHGYERGERLTENRLEAHESLAKRFRGSGGARQLQAGRWFELTQHSQHDTGGEEERQFLLLGVSVHAENALPVSAQRQALSGSLQPQLDAAKRAHGLESETADPTGERLSDYATGGTGHFLVDLEAQRRTQPYRHPLTHHRPVIGGPQTATVVGPANEEIHTDHLNRVRVQFHWDRQGQNDENASVWLRVAQPNAGAGWGGVFVPRIGQEVLIDFLEGDADRPLITGRVYNGDQRPDWHSHGLLSGFKSKTYRGSKYNELVFDDATDQERVRLNSEAEKSQLNLGYLIHQSGNTRGAFRGTGFELRSDAYGAIRAHQGLYLTSWGQLGANGDQLDLTPAKQQLDSAYQLSDTLSQSAADHNADALDSREDLKQAGEDADDTYGTSEQLTGSQGQADQSNASGASDSGGRGQAARMKAPWLHLASPAGITASTPESTHLAQGRSLSVSSGEDVNIATGKSLVASISEKLSLFVYRAGIKLFAAKGKVEVQAQRDEMALTAQKDVKITSTEGRVEINAANGILLQSGGGYVRIEGGNVDVHGPGKIDVKGAQHIFGGPTSLDAPMPELPEGACETQFAGDDAASAGAGPL